MRFVFDTDMLAYAWRRFVHGMRGCPVEPGKCCGCGKPLSAEERHYYEVHCEQCVPIYTWSGE